MNPGNAKSWPSRIFRGAYIAPLALFWVLSLGFALPGPWQVDRTYQLTNYFAAVNGSVSFQFMLVAHLYYSARFECRSTVIPCIGKQWYKVLMLYGIHRGALHRGYFGTGNEEGAVWSVHYQGKTDGSLCLRIFH